MAGNWDSLKLRKTTKSIGSGTSVDMLHNTVENIIYGTMYSSHTQL